VSAGDRAWTDEQRRAIDRRRGDLLLDAAAGSGKTSVLVERFVRSVLDDGIGVEAILTITFTEKAAAELRDRIRARLRALGADAAARATEGAFISTIHGFCARVLRGHALAAGLDPRFAVLDRARTEPLAAAAFDAALQALPDRFGERAAVELVAAYGAPTLRLAILSVHDQLRSAGELSPRLPPLVPLAAGDGGLAALHAAARALAAELGAVSQPGARVQEALRRVTRVLELDDEASLWPAELYRFELPRNGGALSTDACAAYAAALTALRERAAARAAGPIRDLLDGLLQDFAARYAAGKARLSGVDFEDLELLTRRLWETEPALRERYRERFGAIMVDELQDTNRVQLELIEAIAADNLFTVGDAQQSIYGFRHADVELFRRRGRRLAERGARETLRTNFRTRPEIIDVLNPAFAEAMGEEFTPLRAGRPPAGAEDPGARVELLIADKGADWDLEGMASPWRLAEARALADRVAEIVGDGVAPGRIVVLMRASTDMRAYERALERRGLPTYVIGGRGYWAHPQVVDMVAYLQALANPRDEEALFGVLASPLVGLSIDGLVLLSAAARGSRRDPWRVIRELGGADPRDVEGALGELDADDRRRLRAFASWFGNERRRAPRASVETLLERALVITGYDLEMLAMPGGGRRLANVRKLMRLAREQERVDGPDLHAFLAALATRASGADSAREGEAPVEGEGLDAIRLMTIHRAKGLEFDVVCVADLGRSPRPPSVILRVGADGRLGLRLARAGAGGRESALDYRPLGQELKQAEEREERRLFYVAMTRARERLLLSGAAKLEGWAPGAAPGASVGGGPIAWIAPALVPDLSAAIAEGGGERSREGGGRLRLTLARPEGDEAPEVERTADSRPESPSAVPAAVAPPPDPPAASGDPQPPPVGAGTHPGAPVGALSYSALAEYRRCGYRFYAERVLGLPPGPEELEDDGAPPRSGRAAAFAPGRRRGILAHALLERLDFRRPVVPDPDVVRAAAARAGLAPPPGPEELDGLAALVRAFAGSELCRRLGRAREVRREQRFAFGLDADPSHPLVVGALDVIAAEDGAPGRAHRLVVDYKTDRLGAARPAELVARDYAGQQLVYALAALHAGAAVVEIAHLFLEAPDDPVIVRVAADERPALQARLAALAGGVLARRFEVAPDPHRRLCAGCPAEGGLCSWPVAMTRRESADTLF
jgi:ATP-dependent helicase/nuclease subunit A